MKGEKGKKGNGEMMERGKDDREEIEDGYWAIYRVHHLAGKRFTWPENDSIGRKTTPLTGKRNP